VVRSAVVMALDYTGEKRHCVDAPGERVGVSGPLL
jgi:hypothetical protein